MVLEHLFPENWLERKTGYAFLLGSLYSLIGISLARLLFGANSGLASVMFVSILLIPSLKKLFAREERLEERERKFSLRELYKDNKDLLRAYFGVFLGVFLTYYAMSFVGMALGWDVHSIFKEQVFLDPVMGGRASYQFHTFWSILGNNWWVLLACFFLSLISGSGATFFIVWNASAWGVIFGLRSVAAGAALGQSPLIVGALLLLMVIWHVILEGGAYILAGTAGAVISDDAITRAGSLRRFIWILLGLLVAYAGVDALLDLLGLGVAGLLIKIGVALWFAYLLKHAFDDQKHREVFVYNYWLFVVALAVFIIGALVETGVLSWSGLLNTYYVSAMSLFVA
ncbi:hypothetical protein JXA12_03095 [Candidatus Woesearchaeota archaeon]|nr:hypothetical protein [Candidatus Woesearchaeota archaeon]